MQKSPASNPCALAVDPGRAKCGLAVVSREGQVLFRAIVSTEALPEEIRSAINTYRPAVLLVGNGTGAKPILQALEAANLPLAPQSVEESYTSEAARVRFVAENPAPLLQRLLPRSLRTPWKPYDDYVAVILAERYWQGEPHPQPLSDAERGGHPGD